MLIMSLSSLYPPGSQSFNMLLADRPDRTHHHRPFDGSAQRVYHLSSDSIAARQHLSVDQVKAQPWLISDRHGFQHE